MRDDPKKAPRAPRNDEVDEASQESFPASDPPANQPLHPGKPAAHPDHKKGGPGEDRAKEARAKATERAD